MLKLSSSAKRLAAPKDERLLAVLERRERGEASGLVGQVSEAVSVDAVGRNGEPVARRLAREHLRRRSGRPVGLEQRAQLCQAYVPGTRCSPTRRT